MHEFLVAVNPIPVGMGATRGGGLDFASVSCV